jgi:hypothetical protein
MESFFGCRFGSRRPGEDAIVSIKELFDGS